MTSVTPRTRLIIATLTALLGAQSAQAQWVNLARRAVGRIEQLAQSQGSEGVSYDSAAVMLEAPADKVWIAVIHGLRNNTQNARVTQEDPVARVVQFTDGTQIAGIKVSSLGDNLTHLLVSSARKGDKPNASALVMTSVLRVCEEMNLRCTPAQE